MGVVKVQTLGYDAIINCSLIIPSHEQLLHRNHNFTSVVFILYFGISRHKLLLFLSCLQEVCLFLIKCPPYWMLLIAGSIRNIPGYALGAWLPTFFDRQYNVEASHFAIPVGLVVLFGGGAGSFIGGFLSDRYVDQRFSSWMRRHIILELVVTLCTINATAITSVHCIKLHIIQALHTTPPPPRLMHLDLASIYLVRTPKCVKVITNLFSPISQVVH